MGHSYLSSRVEAILVDIDRRREELMGNIAQAVAVRREEGSSQAGRQEQARAHATEGARPRVAQDTERHTAEASVEPGLGSTTRA